MTPLTFAIPTLFGVESIVADELRRLEMSQVRAETGRVFACGRVADIARLNINLRCGERVLLVLGSFPARDFDTLFEGVRALPWEQFIPADGAFPVKGHTLNSQLSSEPACQSIIKKAIATRLGHAYSCTTLPEDGALYQVQFALMKDTATLMLDTSGAGLYKRGYRTSSGLAPLRETLAAALVQLSRYRGLDPFCDPHCGSGTIPIEAALIAKNRAPGLQRRFSAQKWSWLSSELWNTAADEAMDKEYNGNYEIWGGDIDPHVIKMAKANAHNAEVDDVVKFRVADSAAFSHSAPTGRIVTNPPYGTRLMELDECEQLYRTFSQTVAKLPSGWQTCILSPHREFEAVFDRTATRRRKLYNGAIKCQLYMYQPTPEQLKAARAAMRDKEQA